MQRLLIILLVCTLTYCFSAISLAAQQKDQDLETAVTALSYGEDEFLDDDIDVDEEAEEKNQYEVDYQRARMGFLFGHHEFAYQIWEPLASEGYAKAQANLAWMYHTGKGVTKDLDKAREWYTLAAKQNHVIAQNNLGVFYEQGLGDLNKNPKRAAKWYREAAEVGYSYAQYNLGVLYLRGHGVKRDIDEAIFWLEIAALQGVAQAQSELDKINKHAGARTKTSKGKTKKKPTWVRKKPKDHPVLR